MLYFHNISEEMQQISYLCNEKLSASGGASPPKPPTSPNVCNFPPNLGCLDKTLIVTMVLSCTVSEIQRLAKNSLFFLPLSFGALAP